MAFLFTGIAIMVVVSILGCAISSWAINNVWGDDEDED